MAYVLAGIIGVSGTQPQASLACRCAHGNSNKRELSPVLGNELFLSKSSKKQNLAVLSPLQAASAGEGKLQASIKCNRSDDAKFVIVTFDGAVRPCGDAGAGVAVFRDPNHPNFRDPNPNGCDRLTVRNRISSVISPISPEGPQSELLLGKIAFGTKVRPWTGSHVIEYAALVLALEACYDAGAGAVLAMGDAKFVINQLNQVKGCKPPKQHDPARPLFNRARTALLKFEACNLMHIDRSENEAAHRLATLGLNGQGWLGLSFEGTYQGRTNVPFREELPLPRR